MNRTECYCLTFKFPTVRKMTARWGDMEGWRSPICARITLERTRHLNDLKSMAEKTILQAFVLVLLTYTQYQLPF